MTALRLHHSIFSASSQKVRLALAEKRLAHDSVAVDLQAGEQHAPAYRALNPRGVVPTLIHDGAVLIESAAILEYLDDVFPEPALRPGDPVARQRMRAWVRRLDDVHHPANGMMHYAILGRATLLAMPPERLEAMLRERGLDPGRAGRRTALTECRPVDTLAVPRKGLFEARDPAPPITSSWRPGAVAAI